MNDLNERSVQKLLKMYEEYKSYFSKKELLSRRIATAKILKKPYKEQQCAFEENEKKLQQISDDMTFENPIVWMKYKYEAYKNETQPIRTIHDFRTHCSKPGYICTKRFYFLQKEMRARHLKTIDEYDDSAPLSDFFTQKEVLDMSFDTEFSCRWQEREFFIENGRVAKWENE